MVLVAGVDIGNSTTEIVLSDGPEPVAWDRRPTRGIKGSSESIRAAVALLKSLERNSGFKAGHVVTAPWQPVTTETTTVHEDPPDTGRIQLIHCAHHSVVGNIAVTGMPWDVTTTPTSPAMDVGSVIAIVPRKTGYREAATLINQALSRNIRVYGVIVANDEAVLISSRITKALPVVDGADTDSALRARLLFLEVRPAGNAVQTATDVWALHSALETNENELDSLGQITRWIRDDRTAIIGLFDNPQRSRRSTSTASVTWASGETMNLFQAVECFANSPINAVQSLNLGMPESTADSWGVDVTRIMADHGLRTKSRARNVVIASLTREALETSKQLDEFFRVPVSMMESEAAAASIGARTTPGLSANSLILDIGGGTIDLVGENGITAAGAGELLSAGVAQILDIPRGAADWIKRGPAQRVESPRVLLNEDGTRSFTSESGPSVPAAVIGALVTPGPSGLLPFGRDLQPAEWRIIRQSLKLEIIARNVTRILRSYHEATNSREKNGFDIVIVGGPAADDELLPALGRLPMVRGLGRGNVAGILGYRYAVAYGLTQFNQLN